jgi:monofunctional biosynthetic peptidoglycan transglycosylase
MVVLAGALLAWGYSFYRSEFPQVAQLRNQFPVVHYRGPEVAPSITLSRTRPPGWVTIDEVSRMAVGAIIVSEDWAFYQHKGYDPNQIKEAIKDDIEAGGFARGASTITQQVVKNVFLEHDKNLWRKLKELILAMRIEQSVGKRKILETYLNVAEWGQGIFGIGEASRHYFSKPPSRLTAREGAFLAMLLPSPKRYGQSFRDRRLTAYAQSTVDSILKKMARARYLDEGELARELSASLSFESPEIPVSPMTAEPSEDMMNEPEPDLTTQEQSGDNQSL